MNNIGPNGVTAQQVAAVLVTEAMQTLIANS
jgi:hypothetical protein